MKNDALARSFRGAVLNEVWSGSADVPPAVTINDMAGSARNYLEHNPDPARDYECKFEIGPLGIPYHYPELVKANEYGFDPISIADTDCRMDWQYIYMRRMCGITEKSPAEIGVRKRILSYLNEEGYCLANPSAATGEKEEGLWHSPGGTSHILISLGESYKDDPCPETRALAEKVFRSFVGYTSKDTGRLYNLLQSPFKDGVYLTNGWCEIHAYNYGFLVEPALSYYECFGDQAGLDAAIAFAEGQLWDLQCDQGSQRIDPVTGEFTGHVHIHTRTIWGMAHLGWVTGNSRYVDWAKRAYDYIKMNGTDFGWYPEFLPSNERRLSETCVIGDMTATAYYLGLCGFAECFDDIERTVLNYLRFTQFVVDKRLEDFFRSVHKDKPREVVEEALLALRDLEGSFVAQTTMNDLVGYPQAIGTVGMNSNGLHMMGCCPPSGMLALYYAWLATAGRGQDGCVRINTSLSASTCECSVSTDYGISPKMKVVAKQAGDYLIRVPNWVARDSVSTEINGLTSGEVVWSGPGLAYVLMKGIKPGDTIGINHTVPTFDQQIDCFRGEPADYRLSWVGNRLVGIRPDGRFLPLVHESESVLV